MAVLFIVFGAPALAHHSFPAEFDRSQQVIATTNLTAGTLDGSLLPMSGDGTRIVEHWAFSEDRLTMDRTMTTYDSYYKMPLIRRRGSARRDSLEVFEPTPCDPDGYFRYLLDTGHLEEHLAQ